jgi:hypothetical protein
MEMPVSNTFYAKSRMVERKLAPKIVRPPKSQHDVF